MTGAGAGAGAGADAALERARSAVLNVLVAVGLGIGVSGWALARRAPALAPLPPWIAQRAAYLLLAILLVASLATRGVFASRRALRDPARRGVRLYRAHVASAVVGALAVPLGFAFAWWFWPDLEGVGPFWAVALTTGVLALPRGWQIAGLDPPAKSHREPEL